MFKTHYGFNVVFVLTLLLGAFPVAGMSPSLAPAPLTEPLSAERLISTAPLIHVMTTAPVWTTPATALPDTPPPPADPRLAEMQACGPQEPFAPADAQAVAGVPGFRRIAALPLKDGVGYQFGVTLLDATNGYAYLATQYAFPGRLFKVQLTGMTQALTLTLAEHETFYGGAVLDPAGGYAYLGILSYGSTYRGGIIKVRLADMARVATLLYAEYEYNAYTNYGVANAVLDAAAGFAYFGARSYNPSTGQSTHKIIKVQLSDLSRVGALDLPAGDYDLGAAAIHPAAGFAYFGTNESWCGDEIPAAARVFKVQLSNLTLANTMTLQADEQQVQGAYLDPAGGYVYFYTYGNNSNYKVVKVLLADFTRVGAVGTTSTYGLGALDLTNGYIYFATWSGYRRLRLSDFTWMPDVTLTTPPSYYGVAGVDAANGHLYLITYSPPGLVKVRLADAIRLGQAAFAGGESRIEAAVIDPAAGFAYFTAEDRDAAGAYHGVIVKVRLSDFTRVDTLVVTNTMSSAVIDPAAGFAYFSSYGSVYKVRLSDFTLVGAFGIGNWEYASSAVIDPAAGFAYFGNGNRVVKVNLSNFTLVGTLPLTTTDIDLTAAVIDPAGGYAYFGTSNNNYNDAAPGAIYQVRLSDFTQTATLTLQTRESRVEAAVIDPAAGAAYFTTYSYDCYTSTYHLIKVDLDTMTRTATLTSLYLGGGGAVIHPERGYAYFGGGIGTESGLVQVRLADFTATGVAATTGAERNLATGVLDPTTGEMYFGTSNYPGRIIKFGIGTGLTVEPVYDVPYHGVVTYTFLLIGHQTQADPAVTVQGVLPAQVDFLNWIDQPAGATMTNDTFAWSGALAAGQVITFSFRAQHTGGYGDVVETTFTYNGSVASGSSSAAFNVEAQPPIGLTKQATPALAEPGDPVVYVLRLTNPTQLPYTGVVLTDILPTDVLNPQVSSSGSLTPRAGTRYIWDVADLAPGASLVVTITGALSAAPASANIINVARVSGSLGQAEAQAAIVMPGISVVKTGGGRGRVTSTPAGIDCGTDCSQVYAAGTAVTLNATPEVWAKFWGWKVNGATATCPGTGTCALTTDAYYQVEALFGGQHKDATLFAVRNGPWDNPNTWSLGRVPNASDIVEIGSVFTVTVPATPVTVKVLYQDGVLQSARNAPLELYVTALLSNTGVIRGQTGVSTIGSTCGAPGSDVILSGKTLLNSGTIRGGAGRGGSCCGGNGGAVALSFGIVDNRGAVVGGAGGSVICCATSTPGRGGSVTIISGDRAAGLKSTGDFIGGKGGDQEAGCGGNGGCGGDVILAAQPMRIVGGVGQLFARLLGGAAGLDGDGTPGSCGGEDPTIIRYDPSDLEISGTQMAADGIVIFGGNNWTMALTDTAAGMISATQGITLAVGSGGSIDLRGCEAGAFTAPRFFIASDNVILDGGKTLADVVSATQIVQTGAQILGDVAINAPGYLRGERGESFDIPIELVNNSPVAFNYALQTTAGSGLPAVVNIEPVSSTVVTLTVSAPALGGEVVVTVTATAQTSPFHSDRAVIHVYAPPQTAAASLDQTFTGGVFYPFVGTLGCGGVTFAETWTGQLGVTLGEGVGTTPLLPHVYTVTVSGGTPSAATLALCYDESAAEAAGFDADTPLALYRGGAALASERAENDALVTADNVTLPGVFRIGGVVTEYRIYLPLVLR